MFKQNVAVIYGGYSSEHEVSKMSAATIISNLSEEKYNPIPVYITQEGQWLLYDGRIDNIKNIQWEKFGTPAVLSPDRTHCGLLRIIGDKVKNIPIDVAFPVLHGANGEDGTIQGLFEMAGIPYVGCGVAASAIAMDKAFTKIIAKNLGVLQADYLLFTSDQLEADMEECLKKTRYKLGYPCFVKPARTGSSVGVSKVTNKKELESALALAMSHDKKILVEKAIIGRELECAILGAAPNTEASGVGEIISANEFYDYDAKYCSGDSHTLVPAELSQEISDEIRRTSIAVFDAIEGYGLSRADFFLEESTGKIYFNEINTIPGFTSISLYPLLWNEAGVSFPQLLDKLIDLALCRK